MELDELKSAWQSIDRRLQQQNVLNLELLRESRYSKARHGLRPLVFGQIVQIIAGIVVLLVFAPYWIERWGIPHLAICGLLIHAYGVMFVLFGARNLYLIQRIDYALPVLDIQKQLAEIRVWRVRIEAPVFNIVGCFIWIPFVLVEFDWLVGIDLWAKTPQLICWTIGVSFACLLVIYALWHWTHQPQQAGWARMWDDSAAGGSLRCAQAALHEIARFEQE